MKLETTTADLVKNLDAFTRAYIECALWTEEERLKEDAAAHEDEFEAADRWDVNIHAFAPEALTRVIEDCVQFQYGHHALLTSGYEENDDYSEEMAGHDFWLTRNRHGAGFWDRGLGPIGECLRIASHAEGASDLYFGDDGKLYVA